MKSINAVVVGLGSIGQRHARVLKELGHGVTTVSRRSDGDYTTIASAIANQFPEATYDLYIPMLTVLIGTAPLGNSGTALSCT